MMRGSWSRVEVGALLLVHPSNYAYSGKQHPQSAAEIEALTALLGERAAVLLTAPWRLEVKTTSTGRTFAGGVFGGITATLDDSISMRLHREDLREVEPDRPAKSPALRVVVPHPEPAKCEPPPARRPWADDERVGSIYVSRQPDGCARVALVMTVDGVAKQVQASSGLLPEDVGAAVELCARRLAAEVLRRAGKLTEKTGDGNG